MRMGSSSQDLEAELRRLLLSSSSSSRPKPGEGGNAGSGPHPSSGLSTATAATSTTSTTSSGKKIRKRRGKRRGKGNIDGADKEEDGVEDVEGALASQFAAGASAASTAGHMYNPNFPGKHPSIGWWWLSVVVVGSDCFSCINAEAYLTMHFS